LISIPRIEQAMHLLLQNIRFAIRSLLRSPGFTGVAVAALALGIGATTAIFTVLNAIVLEPLPYPRSDRLVHIGHPVPGENPEWKWGLSEAGYFHFLEHNRTLEDLAIYTRDQMTLGADGPAERARTALASANIFGVLGARPVLGRLLTTEDNRASNAPVSAAVLGYDYWQARFGGDPSIVGRTVRIEGVPVEVVGVAERGFHLPDGPTDLWVPLAINPSNPPVNSHQFEGIGRLREGVGITAAAQDLVQLKNRFPEVLPEAYFPGFIEQTGFTVEVLPLRQQVVGEVQTLLWVLLAAVGIVLLIACANVTNLFLVRAESSRREISIRAALGASGRDLASRYVMEGLIIAVLAGALGLALAAAGIRLVVAFGPETLPRLWELGLGGQSLAFAAAAALSTGIFFGVLPLLRTRPSFRDLREGGRGMTASRGRHVVRSGLVVVEIALALVLLAGAALMLRTFANLRAVEPGLDAEGVLVAEIALPAVAYQTSASIAAFHRELATRLEALPGVVAVGATQSLPLAGGGGCALVFTDDAAAEQRNSSCFAQPVRVAPGYFAAMGIPVRGREPTWNDVEARTGEVVISRAVAERLWPGEDPIGKGIRGNSSRPPFYRIVGVAEHVRGHGLDRPAGEEVYFPMIPMEGAGLWGSPLSMTVTVKTALAQPESLAPALRATVTALEADAAIGRVDTMQRIVAGSLGRASFAMLLLGSAAATALILGVIGLYGVVSYTVAQRTSEIGVRMALGARMEQVAGMVVRQSGQLAALGVALGLILAVASTRVLASLLYGVSPVDPLSLAAVAALLVAVALGASYLPARRAARVDPMVALRAE
jgi:putative ABC transport system permease protein